MSYARFLRNLAVYTLYDAGTTCTLLLEEKLIVSELTLLPSLELKLSLRRNTTHRGVKYKLLLEEKRTHNVHTTQE